MHQRGRAPVALSSWTNSTCSSIQFDPRPIGSCQTYRSTGFGAGFPAILPQHPLYQAELAPSGHAQPGFRVIPAGDFNATPTRRYVCKPEPRTMPCLCLRQVRPL
ncbi:hypothetical protein BF95_18250 [Sphingobium sp. Ant17]|nr:hypothetical protein BF95_18250 [Sphingobium sp. Ant17]